MLINSEHPAVAQLVAEWNRTRSGSIADHQNFSQELRSRLAKQLIQMLAPFRGQLVLLYHEFLTMEPTGEHSFAHGSAMWSKTVYWVTVARLTSSPELVVVGPSSRTIGAGEMKCRITLAAQFTVPTRWRWILYQYYPCGSQQLAFGFTQYGGFRPLRVKREPDQVSVPTADPLDISCLGDHLFKSRRGEYDWATKIELHLGTRAVQEWLSQHQSMNTFEQLNRLRQLP